MTPAIGGTETTEFEQVGGWRFTRPEDAGAGRAAPAGPEMFSAAGAGSPRTRHAWGEHPTFCYREPKVADSYI